MLNKVPGGAGGGGGGVGGEESHITNDRSGGWKFKKQNI